MTTYYANFVTGSDAANGLTEGTAWKTIQKFLSTSLSDFPTVDLLYAKAGKIYVEDNGAGYLRHYSAAPNNSTKQCIIEGYTTTPGDGGTIQLSSKSNTRRLFANGPFASPAKLTLKNVQFLADATDNNPADGAVALNASGDALDIQDSNNNLSIECVNCSFAPVAGTPNGQCFVSAQPLAALGTRTLTLTNCNVNCAAAQTVGAVVADSFATVRITGSTILGPTQPQWAVDVKQFVTDVLIQNCTIGGGHGVRVSSIAQGQARTEVRLLNDTFTTAGQALEARERITGLRFENNTVDVDMSANRDYLLQIGLAPEPGSLTTRTSDTVGVITILQGHGLIVNELIDLEWTGGERHGVNVDSITPAAPNDLIGFSGGAGDVLPAAATAINIFDNEYARNIVFRNNVVRCNTTGPALSSVHLLYLGPRCDGGEVSHNTLLSETALPYALVVKGDNLSIHHNILHAKVALYVLGGQNNEIHNNTIVAMSGGAQPALLFGQDQYGYNPIWNRVTRNIIDGSGGTYAVSEAAGTDDLKTKFDENLLVAGSAGLARIQGTTLATLAALKTHWASLTLGQGGDAVSAMFPDNDAGSVEASPLYVNAAGLDFRLIARSPARGKAGVRQGAPIGAEAVIGAPIVVATIT